MKKGMWANRKGIYSRAQRVHEALMQGLCVDCPAEVEEVPRDDPEYLGENHVRCPGCGWQAQTNSSYGWMAE